MVDSIDYRRLKCINFGDNRLMGNNIRDKVIPEEVFHEHIHNLDLKYTLDWKIINNLFSVCTIFVEKIQLLKKLFLKGKKSSC